MRAKRRNPEWTPAQLEALARDYPHMTTAATAERIGRSAKSVSNQAKYIGLRKTPEFLASPEACRLQRGTTAGAKSWFKPGMVPWNKGKLFPSSDTSKVNQFKAGKVPPNQLPVGYIRTNADGFLDIKTEPGMRKWVPLHRWNWMQAHGSYPAPGMALAFKDGNRMNCSLDNVELISRHELMRRNSLHRMPKVLVELVQLRGALNRKINKALKESA